MNIPVKNLKILSGIYKTNLTYQQCAIKGLRTLCCKQQQDKINNWQINNSNAAANNYLVCGGKLTDLGKFAQIRGYANFSPKPAEKEDNLKKTNNDNGEDDNKQVPDHGQGRTLPRLMDFPEIMWPSMLNSIKNWIMVQFIIRPYMDREFNIRDFCQGAKKAMQVRE